MHDDTDYDLESTAFHSYRKTISCYIDYTNNPATSLWGTVPRRAEHGLRSAAFCAKEGAIAEEWYCAPQTFPDELHLKPAKSRIIS